LRFHIFALQKGDAFFHMAGKPGLKTTILQWTVVLASWVLFIRWKRTIANWASELKFPRGYSTPWIEGCKTIFPFSLKVKHDHWQPAALRTVVHLFAQGKTY
jgi:hypothetical protein